MYAFMVIIVYVYVAGKRDYSMKTYEIMRESLLAKAAQLGGNDWTAESVGGHTYIYIHTYIPS
jgi:hypothetical protein